MNQATNYPTNPHPPWTDTCLQVPATSLLPYGTQCLLCCTTYNCSSSTHSHPVVKWRFIWWWWWNVSKVNIVNKYTYWMSSKGFNIIYINFFEAEHLIFLDRVIKVVFNFLAHSTEIHTLFNHIGVPWGYGVRHRKRKKPIYVLSESYFRLTWIICWLNE